ncbi:MAG: phosphoenolpyruvate--protein phosphotransferase [Fusicatenibacter sp.]
MESYQGKGVFGGIAIGRIHVYGKGKLQIKKSSVKGVEAEIMRYRNATLKAVGQLQKLYEKACREMGETDASIFEMHQMLLQDGGYCRAIETMISSQEVTAEYAVQEISDQYIQMFSAMNDDYMKERAADLRDIRERLCDILLGKEYAHPESEEPVILVAEDLSPSETMQMDKDKILSFVTVRGSLVSHTAILARTMSIPALVGTRFPLDETIDGKTGIVDGTNGIFYIDPDEKTCKKMRELLKKETAQKELLLALKGKENITLDGQKIALCANIGNITDLTSVYQNDADGIGLFRSEFIYLGKEDYPTEEEQFQIYKTAVEAMEGKRVVIRTLDIGADKQCGYFQMEQEENPAMGCRAIRICLTRPEVFRTQLRALFRASAYGRLAIMYPMITSVKEIRRIREIAAQAKEELMERGERFGEPEQGITIETPAAALISDLLAREVDFFSIGTNDLTQYTLAIDRQNTALDEFYDPYHPAVMRMISMVTENAHRAGIRVSICGELGADLSLTKEFLALGIDELSVSPGKILPIRRVVLETNVAEYRSGKE